MKGNPSFHSLHGNVTEDSTSRPLPGYGTCFMHVIASLVRVLNLLRSKYPPINITSNLEHIFTQKRTLWVATRFHSSHKPISSAL